MNANTLAIKFIHVAENDDSAGDVRRISLPNKISYSDLLMTARNLFPKLNNLNILWQDEDGDMVFLESDQELTEAIRIMSTSATTKFFVRSTEAMPSLSSKAPPLIHTGVTCDECGVSPIVGIRWKCAIRKDFDLCAACESRRAQPHPMLKICDPNQAPVALIYAMKENETDQPKDSWRKDRKFPGQTWSNHRHAFPRGPQNGPPFGHHSYHPNHGNGPPPGQGPPHGRGPPHGHGPPPPPRNSRCPPFSTFPGAPQFARETTSHAETGCRFGPFGPGNNERRAGKLERKIQQLSSELNKLGSAGASSFVDNPAAAMDSAAAFVTALAEAVVGSSEEETTAAPAPSDVEEQLMQEAIQESMYVNTSVPAVQNLPKPCLRFVRDITFPDGTAVAPGTSFRKAWRVRNDGPNPWPVGAVLVSAGGDIMLADQNMKLPLPVVAPHEDVQVEVPLIAPDQPGLYTSYFRAQTAEEQNFGHRLWASIVVTDPENDWDVVANSSYASGNSKPVSTNEATAPSVSAAQTESSEKAGASISSDKAENEADAALSSQIILWRQELAVLSDMGFTDAKVILPVLLDILGTPVSLSANRNSPPNVDGMHRVIMRLLSK